MTGNEKFDNDAGRIGARMMMEANKSRKNNTLTREKIKQTVENFFGEHEEKELIVTISLDSSNRKTICNFHIASEIYDIHLTEHQ